MESSEPVPVTTSEEQGATLQIELFIARLLRAGVVLSFLIVSSGVLGVVFSQDTGYGLAHLDDLNSLIAYHDSAPEFPSSAGDVWDGLNAAKPYAVISLGLLVLIAIPILRVAASVVAFAVQRDWLYVAITGYVLAILLLSFALGEAGG